MKVGKHKGINIYWGDISKSFFTIAISDVGCLQCDSYKDIIKQIDEKLEEKEKTKDSNFIYFKNFYLPGYFTLPKGYDKLSAEDKTLIENLIKSLNEKN